MMIIGRMTDLTLDASLSASLATSPQGAVRLPDWGLIRARGADARAFLQGQLTGDLVALNPGRHCLAGYCSAKGRLMASFVVWSSGPQDWWLACSADLLPATLKRLSMFVLRAKCQLSDATPEFGLWGLAGDSVRAALGDLAAGEPGSVRVDGERGRVLFGIQKVFDGASAKSRLRARHVERHGRNRGLRSEIGLRGSEADIKRVCNLVHDVLTLEPIERAVLVVERGEHAPA